MTILMLRAKVKGHDGLVFIHILDASRICEKIKGIVLADINDNNWVKQTYDDISEYRSIVTGTCYEKTLERTFVTFQSPQIKEHRNHHVTILSILAYFSCDECGEYFSRLLGQLETGNNIFDEVLREINQGEYSQHFCMNCKSY
jgi:hypothetical protein